MQEGIRKRVVGAALVIGMIIWSSWFVAVARNGFSQDVDGNVLGVDHSIFQTAGRLVADGRGADLYDAADFAAALSEVRDEPVDGGPLYRNPPALAYVFAPTARLDRSAGWLFLSAVGLLAMVAAFSFVGVGRPRLATALVVGTMPGLLTLRLGQLSFLWALVFGLVYRLLDRNRQVSAGLVAAVLVLKPQFAVAVVLWWLLSGPRYRTALVTMAGAGGLLSLVSFAVTPGSLGGFRESVFGALHASTFPSGFSIADTALGLAPSLPAAVVATLSVGIGVVALVAAQRHFSDDLPAMFAAGVFAAVWIPAHLLAYDWVLLAVAIGALWAARPHQRPQWMLVGAALAVWSFAAWAIALIADSVLGARLELAAVGLAAIAWWSFRVLMVQPAAAEAVPSRTLPVNV